MKTTTSLIILFLFSLNMYAQTYCYDKISAGNKHTLAVRNDGTLWAWGNNTYFQLGDGTVMNRDKAVQIGTDTDWSSVSAGGGHSLAIKTNGTLWGWGNNSYFQVGSPTQLGAKQNFTNIITPQQIGTETSWVLCEAGGYHSLAIKLIGNTRTLWSWGRNTDGQLGRFTTNRISSGDYTQVENFTNWSSVSAGENHTVATRLFSQVGRTLWSWGSNSNGQLGTGNTTTSNIPIQVGIDTDWTSVRAGGFHNIARKTNGSLWSWGANEAGQLGIGTNIQATIPTVIGTSVDWSESSYACGYRFSLAKKTNNTLYSWGQNTDGQLGSSSVETYNAPRAIVTAFGLPNSWTNNIVAGLAHSVAQNSNGDFYAWGFDGNGELGNGQGTTYSYIYPAAVICTQTLGVDDVTLNKNTISIFPNPGSNIIYFETKTNIKTIELFDVLGKLMLESSYKNNLQIEYLKPGIYFVKFNLLTGSITKKIMKL